MKSTLQIATALILLLLGILFNVGLIDIRFEEVNYQLGKAASVSETSHSLGIIAKYELIKKRMELGDQASENYELEARVQALVSGDQFDKDGVDDVTTRKKYLVPVQIILNGIRFFLGKEQIHPTEENSLIKLLELGYFWERIRKYNEAIKIYDNVLTQNDLSDNIRAIVLLHKGFCFSMISQYDKSIAVYERIITEYPESDAGKTSWKLLGFLKSINDRRSKIAGKGLSTFEKGKQYYYLMDYRNAIKNIAIYLEKNANSKNNSEALYLKGRAHEELGESDEAIYHYRKIIRNKKSKKWAREANRRMLMLGEFYEQKKKIAEEAKLQLEAYKDAGFMNKVNKFKNMMEEGSLRSELSAELASKEGVSTSNEEVMDLLNSIGDMDLTGENMRQKKRDALRRELISKGVTSEVEVKEFERRTELVSNPFRRPSVIKEVIDGNINQLRYIYNKSLRRGDKISGRITIEITINSNGLIGNSRVINSTVGNSKFENAVKNKILSWRFREVPDSLGCLKIRYPFDFYEE